MTLIEKLGLPAVSDFTFLAKYSGKLVTYSDTTNNYISVKDLDSADKDNSCNPATLTREISSWSDVLRSSFRGLFGNNSIITLHWYWGRYSYETKNHVVFSRINVTMKGDFKYANRNGLSLEQSRIQC